MPCGASGSSTINAKLLVLAGALCHASGGEIIAVGADPTFTISQVARYISHPPLTPTQIYCVKSRCNGTCLLGTAQNPSNIYIFRNGVLIGGTTTDPKGTNTWSFCTPSLCGAYSIVAIYPDGHVNTEAFYERMWLR